MAYSTPTSDRQSASGGATDQAKEKVQEGAEQAKSTVRSQVDQRSTDAGAKLKSQADDIRTAAEELRKQGKDAPAKVAEQAAQRVERVGGYLHDSDADRILSDVEDYARRNPWVVMAGGLAAGFVASRFLKASSSDRYQRDSTRSVPSRGTGHSIEQTGRYATGTSTGAPVSPSVPPVPPTTTGSGSF
jgi:ElaB/YqjD/DUF883 family membrane-anchored ribosome-binding protein